MLVGGGLLATLPLVPTGQVTASLADAYVLNETLTGSVTLHLQEGELIPADALVRIRSGSAEASLPLRSFSFSSLSTGSFYVVNSSLTGQGEGYGLAGTPPREALFQYRFIQETVLPQERELIETESTPQESLPSESLPEGALPPETPPETRPASSSDTAPTLSGSVISDSSEVSSVSPSVSDTNPSVSSSSLTTEEEPLPSSSTSSEASSLEEESSFVPGSDDAFSVESPLAGESLITGAVIGAPEEEVEEGRVTLNEPFSLAVPEGYRFVVIPDSVRVEGEPASESILALSYEEGRVQVELRDVPFGQEALGSGVVPLTFDLALFGLRVQDSSLHLSLEYEGESFLSVRTTLPIADALPVQPPRVRKPFTLQRIPVEGTVFLNLSEYFEGADTFTLTLAEDALQGKFVGSLLTLTPLASFKGTTSVTVTAFRGETSVNSTFIVLVGSTLNITTARQRIVVGQPVVWTKEVTLPLDEAHVTLALPAGAENITVRVQGEDEKTPLSVLTHTPLTGQVIAEQELGTYTSFADWFGGAFGTFTGRVIDEDIIGTEPVSIILPSTSDSYVIEYITPAPEVREQETDSGKEVIISAPDELGYTDVIASTSLPNVISVGSESLIQVIWLNGDGSPVKEVENVPVVSEVDDSSVSLSSAQNPQPVPFDAYDLDGDGKIDYVEWVVPHLSSQTFGIIYVTQAVHLDETKAVLGDVYTEIQSLDGITTSIPATHFIRITFEQPLTSDRDITFHAWSEEGASLTVYPTGSTEALGTVALSPVLEGHRLLLSALSAPAQTFDVEIRGGSAVFDYIIDPTALPLEVVAPTPANNSRLNANATLFNVSTIGATQNVSVLVDVDRTLGVWLRMDDVTGAGAPIDLSSWNHTVSRNGTSQNTSANSGVYGKAFNLSSEGRVIQVNNSAILFIENQSFSAGLWFKTNVTDKEVLMGRHSGGSANGFSFIVNDDTDAESMQTVVFYFSGQIVSSHKYVTNDNWTQVLGTYDARTSNLSLYLDGNLTNSSAFIGTAADPGADANLTIGGLTAGNLAPFSYGFNGSIDEVVFFNRTLGLGEVRALYNATRYPSALNITNLADGQHNFTAWATATDGSLNQTGIWRITTDTVRPRVTITRPQNISYTGLPMRFNVTLTENGTAWGTLSNGATNFTLSGNESYLFGTGFNATNTSIANGVYIFKVYANDTAGNQNNTVNVTFSFLLTAPNITISYPQNRTYGANQTRLNYTLSGDHQTCWYSTDSGATNVTMTCGSNVTGLTTNEGSVSWRVYVNDSTGVVYGNTLNFSVDTVPPGVTIVEPRNVSYRTLPMLFNVTLSQNGSVRYTLTNGGRNYTMQGNESLNFGVAFNHTNATLTEGVYTFKVYGNDSAGNQNWTTNTTFSFDTTPPSLFTREPHPVAYLNTSSFSVNYSVGIDAQACWYTNTSGLVNYTLTCGTNISGGWNEGVVNVSVYANDSAGNINTSATIRFMLDTLRPLVNFTGQTPSNNTNVSQASDVLINLTSNDSTSPHYTLLDFDRTLLGWWRMDELNASGAVRDLSTWQNNATVRGQAVRNTTFSSGPWGRSFVFDGNQSYLSIAHSAGRGITILNRSFTLSLWFRANESFGTTQIIAHKYDCGSSNGLYVALDEQNDGALSVYLSGLQLFTPTFVRDNIWHHVTTTYYAERSNLTFYLDGTVANSSLVSDITSNTVNLEFGANTQGTCAPVSYPLNGSIDESLFFNRSLSSLEVRSLRNATATPYFGNMSNISLTTHRYQAYSVDAAGNLNETEYRVLRVEALDTIPPNTTLLSPINFTYTSMPLLFNVTLAENGTVNYTLDNGITNVSMQANASNRGFNATNTSLGDGQYTIRVYAWDLPGNFNNTVNRTFVVDTLPPNASFTDPTFLNASMVGTRSAYVNFSYADSRAPYGFLDLDKTLRLWLSMDYTNGSGSIRDNRNNTANASGYGFPAPGRNLTGRYGYGLRVSNGSYLQVNASVVNLTTNKSFTTSFWFRTNESTQGIIAAQMDCTGSSQPNTANGLYWMVNDGFTGHLGKFSMKYLGINVYPNVSVTANTWVHAVTIYNATGSNLSLYLNGVLRNSTRTNGVTSDGGYAPFQIGSIQTGACTADSYPFNGSIDELIILNRSISPDEVAPLYNGSAYSRNLSLSEGTHTLQGYALDGSGLFNATDLRTLVLDTLPPLVTIIAPTNISYSSSQFPLIFNVSVSDRGYTIATGSGTASGSFTYSGAGGNAALYDGDTTTSGADPSGVNENTYTQYDFGSGNAQHIRRITWSNEGTTGLSNAITWKLEYSDNAGTWTQVGNTFTTSAGTDTTPQTFDFGESGPHRYWRIYYVSGTTGGNVWVREIELLEYGTLGTLPTNVSASYTLDNGITNVSMQSNGTSIFFNGTNSSLGGGQYTFRVYANDSLGNRNNTVNVTFVIDNVAPRVTIVSPTNTTYTALPLPFNVTLNENGSVHGTLHYGASNFTLSGNVSGFGTGFNATNGSMSNGQYHFQAYANDTSGNQNNTVNVTFVLAVAGGSGGGGSGGGGGSSGGGGSGGGGGAPPTPTPEPTPEPKKEKKTKQVAPAFKIDKHLINVKLKQGDQTTQTFSIKNTGSSDLDFVLETAGADKYFLLDQQKFSLKKGEVKKITLTLLIPEKEAPDIYTGQIVVKAGSLEDKVDIALEIADRKPLFDVASQLKETVIAEAGRIPVTISMTNIGDQKQVDVVLEYFVQSFSGEKIKIEEETLGVNKQATIERSFKLPVELKEGNYLFSVKLSYAESIATSANKFVIKPASFVLMRKIIIGILFALLFFLIILIAVVSRIHKIEVVAPQLRAA